MVRRAVVEHHRPAQQQRTVDQPRPHHPADIGNPGDPRPRPHVEVQRHVGRRLDRKPAVRVQNALRLSRRAGGVDDQQRVLGRCRLHGPVRPALDQFVPRQVPPRAHLHRMPVHPVDHHHVRHRRAPVRRLVRRLFRVDRPPAPRKRVRREQHLRAHVVQPVRDRRRPEAREQRHRHRPHPRDRKHRRRRLRHHRQVHAHRVALPHAEVPQPGRAFLHRDPQRPVTPRPRRALFPFPCHRRLPRVSPRQTSRRYVQSPAHAPPRPLGAAAQVQQLFHRRFEPDLQKPQQFRREPLHIGNRASIQRVKVRLSALPQKRRQSRAFLRLGVRLPGNRGLHGLVSSL